MTREQWIIVCTLGSAAGVAWLSLLSMDMDGGSAIHWSLGYATMVFVMWAIMMVAMMLPPAAPMILLYTKVVSKPNGGESTLAPAFVFAGTYLLLWTGFSVAATLLQWGLSESGLISDATMAIGDARVAGGLLVAAGLYQLTPLKQVCLRNCRSPFSFLTSHWRPGYAGAMRLGLAHGLYCLGCCWMIMVLLFAGGVMNLVWVAVLAAVVLIEKVFPFGERIGQGAGVVAVAAGLSMMSGLP